MKITIEEKFEFIPEWQGNKKIDKDKQIVAEFKSLSGADFSKVLGKEKNERDETEWLLMCKGIRNLIVNSKPLGPIDVYKMDGLIDLYVELKAAYRLRNVVSKKK